MTRWRLAWLVAILAVFFVVQGGEHGTWSWYQLRKAERSERARIVNLERVVDSLSRMAQAIERDSTTQERLARESYGMIRDGEFLYRLVP
jgi:cell division protein FtsB